MGQWMTLNSTHTGELLEPVFRTSGRGVILGVFHHGWYLEAESAVWTLTDTVRGVIPFGVGMKDFARQIPYRKELEGRPFFWKNGLLIFPETELALSLAPIRRQVLRVEEDPAKLQQRRQIAACALQAHGRGYLKDLPGERPGSENPYLAKSRRMIERFLGAMEEPSPELLERCLLDMIGFGQGLTPSMDDWLTGFLYALRRIPHKEEPLSLLCREVLRIARVRTNKISAAYVSSAAGTARFTLLEQAVFADTEADFYPLLEIGSSSGSDMLCGVIAALDLCETVI